MRTRQQLIGARNTRSERVSHASTAAKLPCMPRVCSYVGREVAADLGGGEAEDWLGRWATSPVAALLRDGATKQ